MFDNPNKEDLHAGSVKLWDTEDPDRFAIRTWQSFSNTTMEYEASESHWRIDRDTNTTYLILFRKRSRYFGWKDFDEKDLMKFGASELVPKTHIRDARGIARDSLGLKGPYRKLVLIGQYDT
jgi:hypothetical protein